MKPEDVGVCVCVCVCEGSRKIPHCQWDRGRASLPGGQRERQAVFAITKKTTGRNPRRCPAMCCNSVASCSVLQCVAVCCSVLQCVAVCCSVLQCVAVCCSVLQCVGTYVKTGCSWLYDMASGEAPKSCALDPYPWTCCDSQFFLCSNNGEGGGSCSIAPRLARGEVRGCWFSPTKSHSADSVRAPAMYFAFAAC